MPRRARGLSKHQPIEPVGAGEGARRLQLVAMQALLLRERRVRPADVEAARRQRVILRQADLEQGRLEVDRGCGVDRVVDAFEPYPAACIARQGEAQQAELQDLGDAGRIGDRHHRVDHGVLALMRRGRGFAGVVVAHAGEHAAECRRAGEVAVAEGIARAIDARTLAVPHAEHALIAALAEQLGLLRAPQRGGGEILVDRRLDLDVVLVEKAPGGGELLVEAAERRAAIARDVARRVVAGRPVALALQHRQPHQGLNAGQKDPAVGLAVFVVETDVGELHARTSRPGPGAWCARVHAVRLASSRASSRAGRARRRVVWPAAAHQRIRNRASSLASCS